jgi:hypothetical protein
MASKVAVSVVPPFLQIQLRYLDITKIYLSSVANYQCGMRRICGSKSMSFYFGMRRNP